MTDNEIIKALKVCLGGFSNKCVQCPFPRDECCEEDLKHLIINLIDRMKGESNKYRNQAQAQKGELTRLYKQVTEQKAEIERLQKEGLQINETFMGFVNKRKAEAKQEAKQEFAEKLKERKFVICRRCEGPVFCVLVEDIEALQKEMEEEYERGKVQ